MFLIPTPARNSCSRTNSPILTLNLWLHTRMPLEIMMIVSSLAKIMRNLGYLEHSNSKRTTTVVLILGR